MEPVKKLIFEMSEFIKPLALKLPCPDAPDAKERDIKFWEKAKQKRGLPPIFISSSFERVNKGILLFLIENGFASEEKVDMGEGWWSLKRGYLYYTDKIKPFIISGSHRYGDCKRGYEVLLAIRSLKSIDYIKKYQSSSMGFKSDVCDINFTYTLVEKLPGLPKLDKEYKGRAKLFIHRQDGVWRWRIESLSLTDSKDEKEYIIPIKEEPPKRWGRKRSGAR
jgi:hypothetical protein